MGAWEVVDLPEWETAIPYQIVFKEKLDGEGKIKTYWVWIVTGGHKQVEGKSYSEMFAAAAKLPLIRVVLGHAAHQDWEINHVNIKSAYLNAPLKEKVFMKPPPGVLKLNQQNKVCPLLKGLYGLHQAGRGWYKEMSGVFIKKLVFKKSAVDHSIFYRKLGDEHTIVVVAMDNMAITLKHNEDVEKLKNELHQHWKFSNLGELKWYLGFHVQCDWAKWTILINQKVYIEAMVDRFKLSLAKLVLAPMDLGAKYSKDQCPSTPMQMAKMCGIPYMEGIGSILWPVMILQPDCAFTISMLVQFMQNPAQTH